MSDYVPSGSPADLAGLEEDDLVTHVDNVRARNKHDFTAEVTKHRAGDDVMISVERQTSSGLHLSHRMLTIGAKGHTISEVRELRRIMIGCINDADLRQAKIDGRLQ